MYGKNMEIKINQEQLHIKADLHTHTCASGHATADTITDMAREAAARGISLLGISDHGPASVGSAGLSYFRGLHLGTRERFGVRMLYGAEANIIDRDGHLDIPDEILKTLDYVIISMHQPIYVSGTASENTLAYLRAMNHPKVRIIGHCDDSRFPVDYETLVRSARAKGIYPELNNVSLLPNSYRRNCRPNSMRLLTACAAFECPVLLSSDSHGTGHIGDVGEALKLIHEKAFPDSLIENFHPERLLLN